MTTEYQVLKYVPKKKTVTTDVIKAERHLIRFYPAFYTHFSGYRNSHDISDLVIMEAWCYIRRINWHDIQHIILNFINCKIDDEPIQVVKKSRQSLQSKSHKYNYDKI